MNGEELSNNIAQSSLIALRFAWLPQLMVLCVMLGSAGPNFDFNIHTEASQGVLNAKRITFFSLCLSIALAWAPLAADYYVYYPPHVKRWRTFTVTVLGCGQAMLITILIGAGLGTALASSAVYRVKYGDNPGDLLMMAYDSLGGFGKFCAVINVLSLLANNTPSVYSMGMNFQMLGDFFRKVPRAVFVTFSTVIYAACAMGGRNQLYEVFKSFLPLIGYWVMMFFVIIVQEDLLFRRRIGYDWSAWNSPQKLPMGIAAGTAFLIGWAGAIVGMVSSTTLCSGLSAKSTCRISPTMAVLLPSWPTAQILECGSEEDSRLFRFHRCARSNFGLLGADLG